MTSRPNILLIVTDEERVSLPRPQGFSLPARERIAARGTTFERYCTASAQCSAARSVIYTGQHLPLMAADPGHRDLVEHYRVLLENLIDAEIGTGTRAWVTERPRLLGWPTWHGDDERPETLVAAESQTRH